MEKSFTNDISIDLRGRDFKDPNYWFVSPRGASRDAGTDVTKVVCDIRLSRNFSSQSFEPDPWSPIDSSMQPHRIIRRP